MKKQSVKKGANEPLFQDTLGVTKIRYWLNYQLEEKDLEPVTQISETVPVELPNLVLMLNRSKFTGQVTALPNPIYTEEVEGLDYPDFEKMDVFEIIEARKQLSEDIERYKEDLAEASRVLLEKQNNEVLEREKKLRMPKSEEQSDNPKD